MQHKLTFRDRCVLLDFLYDYNDKKKTSEEWLNIFGKDVAQIYDPDGWRAPNSPDFHKDPITLNEFIRRFYMCTIGLGFLNERWVERHSQKFDIESTGEKIQHPSTRITPNPLDTA